eukprot:TRINITY_DN13063_c0_g1_i1.p1 TRINITY_DN13063_c0_g1~~TRINITY_DN13063_c0_g1_i1.p1  ORF type:complete len:351 (+),score=32.45 TRINITY_DN13063_c0_g1_i1:65-1117(+)
MCIRDRYRLNEESRLSGLQYCRNAAPTSCCSREYFGNASAMLSKRKDQLITNFSRVISIYKERMDFIRNIEDFRFADLYGLALEWAPLNPHSTDKTFENIDSKDTFIEYFGLMLDKVQSFFAQCSSIVLQHEAGRMCSVCHSNFLWNYVSGGTTLNLALSVCNQITENCFGYVKSRIDLSTYVNIVNTIQRMLSLGAEIANMTKYPNILTKLAFARGMTDISTDDFWLVPECKDELDCRWLCKNFVAANRTNFELVVNPTANPAYNLMNFTTTGNTTSNVTKTATKGRLLDSTIVSPYNVTFTLKGYDTMEVARDYSNLDYIVDFTPTAKWAKTLYGLIGMLSLSIILCA